MKGNESSMENDLEIQELIERYKKLEPIVANRMDNALKLCIDIPMVQTAHRIKTMESIKEKIVRKNYSGVSELRDILGFRVICFFSQDVDIVAEKIAEHFRIDYSLSVDKRKLIDVRSFGYLSLHYICALPEGEEFGDLWFEVQIMSVLQHSWAEIEHDLGYKTEIEVPRDIRRSFSRAASLLETADIIFSGIKKELDEYKLKVQSEINEKSLDNVFFDGFTIVEFTEHSDAYNKLVNAIAAITDAHISDERGHTENLLMQMEYLGIHTFGDMISTIEDCYELALELARKTLANSGLDELSSTVGYYYIFRAKLIRGDFKIDKIEGFFRLTMKDEKNVIQNAEKILKAREVY